MILSQSRVAELIDFPARGTSRIDGLKMQAGGRFEPGKRANSPSIHKVIHHPARRFPAKARRTGTLRGLLPQTGGMGGLTARFDGVADLGGEGGLALEQVVD
ncbi:MAG: hypothetical protein RLZZ179_1844 [Verrucomicrobiota bacterium]|jgi:hypothetical protein